MVLVDLSTVGRVWAVFRVKTGKEAWAEAQASQGGMGAYCPRFKKRLRDPLPATLFPGYLFLNLSPALELAQVRWLPGMFGPLLFQNQLGCVEDELVEVWKEREGGRGYSIPEPKPKMPAGQRVRVKEGPFAGFFGIVLESLPTRQRVRLLLEHLGQSMSVEMDVEVIA
jgi:transcription antitermination factor NusG